MAFLRYSVLAVRILLWVMLAALVVFFLATGFGIVHERGQALRTAHVNAQEAVRQSLPALAISLWKYDAAGMNALLDGMLRSTAIVGVEVVDLHQVVATVGQLSTADVVDRVWEVSVMSPDGRESIGALRVAESYAEVNAQAMASFRMRVLTDLLKIVGLAAILFVIVYRKVARHLYQLAEDVTHLDLASAVPQVAIERRKAGNYRDEFDILVDTINGFLAEKSDEMRRRAVAEDSLRERVSEIEATLGALSDGVIALDREARVRYANGAACALLHASSEMIKGRPMDEVLQIVNTVDDSVFRGVGASVIAGAEALHLRDEILIRAGESAEFDARVSAVPVPGSGEVAMILVFTDISEEVRNQKRIKFQAFHDPLTRLGNRSLLVRDLARDIEQVRRTSGRLALLCLDLDNFKNINDTLGHMIGDVMLKQLARRLEATVHDPGWVTRHGGDEFIVVLPGIESPACATGLAEALMAAIAEPFQIEHHELRVTSSIGISLCPDHGEGIGKLLSNADLAMYAAKRQSKNTYRIFEESLLERSAARLTMENGLRVALREQQFSLVYQPKVGLTDHRVDSVEALLRWDHPQAGQIPPTTFIPVAEDVGLISEIGAWVLRESLAAAARLRAELGYAVAFSVNVSPVQFRGDELLTTLHELRRHTPELAGLIEVELTETALSGDIDEVVCKLQAFRDLGLKVAIDDFGTGYSSLAYLKNFPIDILKIDQAFIRGLTHSARDKAIVTTVVQLARSLGFKTVAEGVEAEAHAAVLAGLGCDYAQGYWYSRPVPEHQLAEVIRGITGGA